MKTFLTRYLIPYLPPLAYVMWAILTLVGAVFSKTRLLFDSDFDSEGLVTMIAIVVGLLTYVTYWLGVVLNTVRGIIYFRKSRGHQLKLLSIIFIIATFAQIHFLIGFESILPSVLGIGIWFIHGVGWPYYGMGMVLPVLVVSVPLLDWLIRWQQGSKAGK